MTVKTDYLDDSENDDRLIIRTSQDVAPILESNRQLFNETSGYTPSRDMKHVASVPLVVFELWKSMYGEESVRDRKFLARLLNSNEWKHLRTSSGRI